MGCLQIGFDNAIRAGIAVGGDVNASFPLGQKPTSDDNPVIRRQCNPEVGGLPLVPEAWQYIQQPYASLAKSGIS
jgi:hypothetical protein